MKLYYMQGACSLAPHLILEELGMPYEAVQVSMDRGDLEKPEFLKLNPTGAVPVLILDDGTPLTENVAILPYLADLGKGKKLIAPTGTVERAHCMQWIGFLATELHNAFRLIFGAQAYAGKKPELAEEYRERGRELAARLLDVTESRLPASGFALGPDYSIADAYLFVFFSWAKHLKFEVSLWPKYSALVSRVTERPATLRILKKEDLLD